MKLLEQTCIAGMKLRNRTYMAPMGTQTNADGSFSDRSIRYYEERAKGGFALIITGANQVTMEYEAKACNVLGTAKAFEQMNFLARRIHNHGAKLCIQLTPGLGRMQFTTGDVRPYSASEVDSFWFPEVKCKAFSKEDIQFLVTKMAEGAATAKNAGADAVELHGYGGYLMDQFQSTLWNKRTDEYGGSLENRMRFSVECVKAIRQAVGPNFPILYKFTPYHGVEGGRELDEGTAMAKILEEAGVDALHVDVGCYEAWYKAINTVYQPPMVQLPVAAEIKKHVTVPVLSQGKMQNPADAEAALQDGKADMIGLGHMAIADPYWVQKVKKNETYDITPCIGCNECLFAGFSGKILHCAVNPLAFAEDYYPVGKDDSSKRILVIGGGPGGIMAALTAEQRGMQVELWEKRNVLGGLLLAAGGPRFKKDVKDYVDYLVGKLHRSSVKVLLMKDGTPEEVLAGGYDKVIFATGATPVMPPIKGIDQEWVTGANDLLTNKKTYGKQVVVVGAGLVGCETACHCAEKADSVTMIEMLPEILATTRHCKNNDQALRQLIEDCKVKSVTSAKVLSFEDGKVIYEKDGKKHTLEADTVAIAAGYKANTELYDALSDKVDCALVGDAENPDNILSAVHHGFHAVRCI
ncbi:FAD-dependent oxidoreductase [uncultured Sphaerochaeta sp.]|uniref:oxidoreductase n=1 Tax=uncultured Sphaerochaeta sp. TaxID=886478 RepID=UPI0029CA58DF|nr:FAD-dependent oxidoreductase [uncultured Sphaerochaeta sp.]